MQVDLKISQCPSFPCAPSYVTLRMNLSHEQVIIKNINWEFGRGYRYITKQRSKTHTLLCLCTNKKKKWEMILLKPIKYNFSNFIIIFFFKREDVTGGSKRERNSYPKVTFSLISFIFQFITNMI